MKNFIYILVAGIGGILFVVVIWLLLKEDSPHLKRLNGGMVSVIGCDSGVNEKVGPECLILYCGKALMEAQLVPSSAHRIRSYSVLNASNRPDWSKHYIQYAFPTGTVYAACELDGVSPIQVELIGEDVFLSNMRS